MTPDPTSLQNLQDIVGPPPVPFWPPAPGWYLLLAIALGFAILIAIRAVFRYRRNAYRRLALAELRTATRLPQIAALLKRTALAAYPRDEVASLSGEAWLQWLGDTSGLSVPEPVGAALAHGVYADPSSAETRAVTDFAARWIRHHRGVLRC